MSTARPGAIVQEWTLEGMLDEVDKINSAVSDRSFAFVLGSGASFTSGIPTGKDLAERWLKDLHRRECLDGASIADWVATGAVGIEGFTSARAAEHYPQLFERRFRGDREAGYAELEDAMEGKEPSFGYSLLAEVIQNTRHKVVVTTNFDNLVADALAMHAHKPPLIVAHESLAGFVRPQLRRPLVAKIHRDLFLQPKNDKAGVDTLEIAWVEALRKLFLHYTPIVVGYGGNDGSLMGLLQGLNPGEIVGRLFWCYRLGSPPSEVVLDVLRKHDGVKVAIDGFDEFMLRLAAKLVKGFDVAAISARIAQIGEARADRYRQQAENLQHALEKGTSSQRRAGSVLTGSARDPENWWTWELKARSEKDPALRDLIYKEAIAKFPASAELIGNYAIFLADAAKDYDAAELMFKRALALETNRANTAGNFAIFLKNHRKDYDAAEAMYVKALEIDPNQANNAGGYANFLGYQRKNPTAARAMYKRALEIDPNHHRNTANYAQFLAANDDVDAAEAMFKRALLLDASDATTSGNYAAFLARHRHDADAAEAMYRKALELNPNGATNLGLYAGFLASERRDLGGAERMFKQALALEPDNATNLHGYANFLADERHDLPAAQSMYDKALALDPTNAATASNYANFLTYERGDFDAAETMYRRALALDPVRPGTTGAYALFLADRRHDAAGARRMFERAIELDPDDSGNLGSFALFLDRADEADAAEPFYRRAIEHDEGSAATLGNYAIFLTQRRRDLPGANAMYLKAIERDPSHATNVANYASFLAYSLRDPVKADATYRRAVALDPAQAGLLGNFACFLAQREPGGDEARSMFTRALEADPSHVVNVANCADFLAQTRADDDAAEAMYKRAIGLDPKRALTFGNYAGFLSLRRGDADAAEAMFGRALELDPAQAGNVAAYAQFLGNVRHDNVRAEAMYRRATALDPADPNLAANLSAILLLQHRGVDARAAAGNAASLAKGSAMQPVAEALLYRALAAEIDGLTAHDDLARLKALLAQGYERGAWSFDAVFAVAFETFDTDRQSFYRALGAAILDASALPQLDRFAAWRELVPLAWTEKDGAPA